MVKKTEAIDLQVLLEKLQKLVSKTPQIILIVQQLIALFGDTTPPVMQNALECCDDPEKCSLATLQSALQTAVAAAACHDCCCCKDK